MAKSKRHKRMPEQGISKPAVHLPWGDSLNHLRLKDPLDVRPVADLVSKRALQKIKNLKEGQKFALIIGEYHHLPTHIMAEQLVISRLMDEREDIRVAFELEANSLTRNLRKIFEVDIPSEQEYQLAHFDVMRGGHAALNLELAHTYLAMSAVSQKNLLGFCSQNRVSAVFADVGCLTGTEGKSYLDLNDIFLKSIIERKSYKILPEQSPISPAGMQFRNMVMATRVLNTKEHAIMLTGAAHIFGGKYFPYAYSLHDVFNQGSFSTAQVVLAGSKSVHSMPVPETASKNTIVIDGLDATGFKTDDGDYSVHKEYEYLRKIFKASGNEVGDYVYTFNAKAGHEDAKKEAYKLLVAANEAGFDIKIPDALNPNRPKGWGERIKALLPF